MGWFEEQISYRKQKDNEAFEDAIDSIAGAILGRRLMDALSREEIAGSAIEEILKYYGCKPKGDELPPQITDIDEMLDYRLRPFGITRRTVTLDKGWYKNAVSPMLGTLKESGDAVALLPGRLSGYIYLDLATGKRVKLSRKTEQLIDNTAICFYNPLPLRKLGMFDLLKFMYAQWSVSDITVYLGMMLITTLVGLLSPLFTKWLFGTVLESRSVPMLIALAVFMVCFSVSQLLISTFQSLINKRVSTKQNTAVEAAVMNRLVSLPVNFFKDYSSGELYQRSQYVNSLCTVLSGSVQTTGISSLFSLIYIGQIVSFAPALVTPAILITLATLVCSTATTLAQTKIMTEQMKLSAKTSGMTYSTITGIQKIKLAGAEKRMFSRWAKQYAKEASLAYNPPMFIKLSGTLNMAITLIGTLIMYVAAVKSHVTVADYFAFNASYALVSGSFTALAGVAMSLANIRPTLEMAKPILEAEPEISTGKEIVTQLNGSIELSNVSFRYGEDMPNVIDDLSLKIRPGEYVAIVGSTGCGKSTLMRLLLGFETPQRGAIYYDRKDITRVDMRSLRKKIGVVTQNGKLFLGDIYSNIVIAAPQLTLDDAWEAAELASVADDIRAMPMGMQTLISEGQGGISGGQRQRLMIARAVVAKPKILMFDEATSALDNVTQRHVSDAIDDLKATRIVIAHRLSTIRHCDRIIVLDKGKIAEDGTYEELIAKNGFFAELVDRQRLDNEE